MLQLLVGGPVHDRQLEFVDLVIHRGEHGEERVGKRVEHRVDDVLLARLGLGGKPAPQVVELGALGLADRDDVAAADHQVDLDQLRGSVRAAAGPVEHDQHVVAVAVQLRTLAEVDQVLDGEWMPAEPRCER